MFLIITKQLQNGLILPVRSVIWRLKISFKYIWKQEFREFLRNFSLSLNKQLKIDLIYCHYQCYISITLRIQSFSSGHEIKWNFVGTLEDKNQLMVVNVDYQQALCLQFQSSIAFIIYTDITSYIFRKEEISQSHLS